MFQNRPNWNNKNQDELYILYFTILNTNSAIEYLELIFEQELYGRAYQQYYC